MKSRFFLVLFCLWYLVQTICTQNQEYNYVRTRIMNNDNGREFVDNIQYYDGFGRATQMIQKGVTPNNADLVSMQLYDSFGRENGEIISTPVAGNSGYYVNHLLNKANEFHNDLFPYTKTVYDNSPLNRILNKTGSGVSWHSIGKRIATEYLTNTMSNDLKVIYFSVEPNTKIRRTGYYDTLSIQVQKIKDEDDNYRYTFMDMQGRLILERSVLNINQFIDTYYVYDDRDNLCYVLPPYAVSTLSKDGVYSMANSIYAYYYRYDHRNRCIEKKIPGMGVIYYVYDKADRLRMSQDSEQRKRGEWLFNKYDVFGRLIVNGIYKRSNLQEDISQNAMITEVNASNHLFESFYINGVDMYTCNTFPVEQDKMTTLISNYYDNYDYLNLGKSYLPISFSDSVNYVSSVSDAEHISAKGLPTGSKTLLLDGSDTYLWNCVRYDNKSRPIQTFTMNVLGGLDKEFLKYTFTGNPKERILQHNTIGKGQKFEKYVYEYDHAGRIVEVWHKIDNQPLILLAKESYDELGQLKKRELRKGSSYVHYQEYMQTINYEYNIRGWLTSIDSEIFKEHLYYDTPINSSSAPCYNGNISAMTMQMQEKTVCGYEFNYDALNRLSDARYGEGNDLSQNKGIYNYNVGYDFHGNITDRYVSGKNPNENWNISNHTFFDYVGNQLVRAETQAGSPPDIFYNDQIFKDESHELIEYVYDDNGNMVQDRNKKVSLVTYNYLNLPSKVQFSNGNVLNFVYDASGKKHKMENVMLRSNVYVPMGSIYEASPNEINYKDTTYYCSNVIVNGRDIRVNNPYGFVKQDGNEKLYWLQLKDHLGNVCAEPAEHFFMEWTFYYPFGVQFDPYNRRICNSFEGERYGGKELLSLHGLNVYDFGARTYDVALGRWNSIDPLCEKYYSVSPYVYCNNNPIRYIDPDGRSTRVKRKKNGTFEVIGGDLEDDDFNIYEYLEDEDGNYTIRGESIGITTSITSFYDSYADEEKGNWAKGSIINPSDKNGDIFLKRFLDDDPSLIGYMGNATRGEKYDFKTCDLSEGITYQEDKWYRGMPLTNKEFVTFDMDPVYTSAKDIGNMVAGYIAAIKGLTWKQARIGFDGLQKGQDRNLKSVEKASSQNAQKYGFVRGKRRLMINNMR